MNIIDKIIKDIDEKLLFGEEKKLEYRFPNKHMIEIILRGNDLEFYYVPTEEIRGKLTLAKFINKNKITNKKIKEIITEYTKYVLTAQMKDERWVNNNTENGRIKKKYLGFDAGSKTEEVLKWIKEAYMAA